MKEWDFLYLMHEIEKTYRGKVPQTLLRSTRAGHAAFDQYRKVLKAAF